MTTTASTNSASKSTPNDSSRLNDNDVASESIAEQLSPQEEKRNLEQHHNHNNLESSNESQDSFVIKQSPSPKGQKPVRRQSSDNGSTSTASPTKRVTPSPPPESSSISSNATTSTPTASTHSATNATDPANRDSQLEQSPSEQQQHQQQQSTTNSGTNNNTEQKRPMNAFLLFCKRQRSLVREKYPNLENRGITKILGDWWSKLDKEQKSKYTDLARQHKEAFMKANPDFKWCKTPNVSSINNNINTNSSNNETYSPSNQSNQQLQLQKQHLQSHQQNHLNTSAINAELLSMQSLHQPMDVVHQTSNSMDLILSSRQQLGAPKPPKKRFLESKRNDSNHILKNHSFASNDTSSNGRGAVPPISLDQDTLDRVIETAFLEDSSSTSGVNTCKCSTRTSTNLTTTTSSLGANPKTFSSTSSSTSVYNMSIDEPVDFSMNRTINTTNQHLVDTIVEKCLSDNSSSFSKMNGTNSLKVQSRPLVRKDNPDDT